MGCENVNSKGACCPPGSWPAITIDHRPTGQTQTIDGLKVYHVGQGNRVLIIFQDIFGTESGRHKALADTYSVMGYNVYMPEFLEPPYSGSIQDVPKLLQVVKRQKLPDIDAKYEKLSNHLKAKGYSKWLTAGYCWGAWVAFHLASIYDHFTAIAAIHPSFQCEFFYGGSDQALAKKIKPPAFLYAAGNDNQNVKANGSIAKILQQRFQDKTGVVQFPKQHHGWMVRSDPKDPEANKDVEQCFKLSHDYFNKFA